MAAQGMRKSEWKITEWQGKGRATGAVTIAAPSHETVGLQLKTIDS